MSLKSTKRRISSVKSTQKITKAMKLVSSSKFAKAQVALEQARPYSAHLASMVGKLLPLMEETNFPLSTARPEKRVLLAILASDRGLCGGLNANLVKGAQRFIAEQSKKGITVELALWGKRSHSLAGKRD